ncbi:hypothetical protein GCM10020000_11790 [Streptomyces olivoverticillatus]
MADRKCKPPRKSPWPSPADELHNFIQVGQYMAERKDQLAATHIAQLRNLLDQGAIVEANAQVNRWLAAQAAAIASRAKDEAQAAAAEAQKSATQAKDYASQADKSASQAETSAAKAAQSAITARNAADTADRYADDAEDSAAESDFSVQYAQTSAGLAHEYADAAHRSALKAGKSEKEASELAAAAWKDVLKKRQDEEDAARKQAAELRKKQREQRPKRNCAPPINREVNGLLPCALAPGPWTVEAPVIDPTLNNIVWAVTGLNDIKDCITNPTLGKCTVALAMVIPPIGGELRAVRAGEGIFEGVEGTVKGTRTYHVATGGFKVGVTPDEITAINRGFGGETLVTGSPENMLINISRYNSFWEKTAVVIRDIAGAHMFNNGNKRTAQAVAEQLMERNNITSGPTSEGLRSVVDRVGEGKLRSVGDIARALRGY